MMIFEKNKLDWICEIYLIRLMTCLVGALVKTHQMVGCSSFFFLLMCQD